jgi:hypothetical protein
LKNEPRIVDLTGQVYGQGYMNLGAAEDPLAYRIDAAVYAGSAGAGMALAGQVAGSAAPLVLVGGEITVGTVWAPASWGLDAKDVGVGLKDIYDGHWISGSFQVGASVIGFLPLGDIVKKPVIWVAKWARRFKRAGGDEVIEGAVKVAKRLDDAAPLRLDVGEFGDLVPDKPPVIGPVLPYNEAKAARVPGYDAHHLAPPLGRADPSYNTGPTLRVRNDNAGGRVPGGVNLHTGKGGLQNSLNQHIRELGYTRAEWISLPEEARLVHLRRYYASIGIPFEK